MVNSPAPGSPEWTSKVTASKVAAILGLSPWESPYSMWMKMHGDIPSDDGTNAAAKSRGHYLEDGIVRWWLDQHPEFVEPGGDWITEAQHYAEREDWAAATPDTVVRELAPKVPERAGRKIGGIKVVMDAKTAASDDDWGDEPPAYYLAQSVWQMWVCDADVAYIAVLFGRPQLAFREYRIERDRDLEVQVVAQCRDFYDSLHMDIPPELDDTVATYDAVRAVHPDIDPEADVEIPRDLAHEYVTASLALKDAETADRAAKTRLLDAMGRARISTCDGAKVARRQPNKYGISLVRVAKHIDPPAMEAAS